MLKVLVMVGSGYDLVVRVGIISRVENISERKPPNRNANI